MKKKITIGTELNKEIKEGFYGREEKQNRFAQRALQQLKVYRGSCLVYRKQFWDATVDKACKIANNNLQYLKA